MSRRTSVSTLFAAAALAFLLPFGTVSCDEERVSFTGAELVTRTVDADTHEPGGTLADAVESSGGAIALVTFALALVGAAVGARRDRGGGWAIAGASGLFLLAMRAEMSLAEITYGVGYLLSFAAFAGAGLTRFVFRIIERERRGQQAWTWVVAVMVGTPVTAIALACVALVAPSG